MKPLKSLKSSFTAFFTALLGCLFLMACLPKAWSDADDHSKLRQLAIQYLSEQIKTGAHRQVSIRVQALDPRVKLAPCPEQALEAFLPSSGLPEFTSTVGIRCKNHQAWSIYLPVHIDVVQPVLVTRRPLAKATLIQSSDLITEPRSINQLRQGFFTDNQLVLGKSTQRPLAMGMVIQPNHLSEPLWVKKGDPVTVFARYKAVRVSNQGQSLMDGKLGDSIQVKCHRSGEVVHAQVTGLRRADIRQ